MQMFGGKEAGLCCDGQQHWCANKRAEIILDIIDGLLLDENNKGK